MLAKEMGMVVSLLMSTLVMMMEDEILCRTEGRMRGVAKTVGGDGWGHDWREF